MKKTIIFIVLFVCFFARLALGETTLKAQVDKKIATTDEVITYKLVITSSETKIPKPQVPAFEGFKVVSSAQSTTMNFSSGGVKNSFTFIYMLVAVKAGELEIKPATIKIKDDTLKSESFKIEVKQGRNNPLEKFQPKKKQLTPTPGLPQEQTTL